MSLPKIGAGTTKQSNPNRGSHYVGLDLKDAVIAELSEEFGPQPKFSHYFRALWNGYVEKSKSVVEFHAFLAEHKDIAKKFADWTNETK